MNYFIDPITSELYAYDDEQVAAGVVKPGLSACPPRPSAQHVWNSGWVLPAPSKSELIAANISAIQAELDRQAQAKGYDNILSACSYAAPEGSPFQVEGAAFLAWRSAVWSNSYTILAQVEAGKRSMPSPAESVAMMPALVLP